MSKDGIYNRMVDHEWKKVKIEKGKVYYENDKGGFELTPFKPEDMSFNEKN